MDDGEPQIGFGGAPPAEAVGLEVLTHVGYQNFHLHAVTNKSDFIQRRSQGFESGQRLPSRRGGRIEFSNHIAERLKANGHRHPARLRESDELDISNIDRLSVARHVVGSACVRFKEHQ